MKIKRFERKSYKIASYEYLLEVEIEGETYGATTILMQTEPDPDKLARLLLAKLIAVEVRFKIQNELALTSIRVKETSK